MNRGERRSREILACMGDPSRFRLVLSLLEEARCVTELAGEVGLSQSCTTRHLQLLEREGIVTGLREGKRVVFRLRTDRPRVRALLGWVVEAPPDRAGERVGGADLHADAARSGPGDRSPRASGRGRGDRGLEAGPTAAWDPPGHGEAGAGGRAAPAPARVPPPTRPGEDGPAADPPGGGPEPPDPGSEPRPGPRATDMEDWLL